MARKTKPAEQGKQVLVNVTLEVSCVVRLPPGVEPGSEAARDFVMAVADGTQGNPGCWPVFTRAQQRQGWTAEWSGTEAWNVRKEDGNTDEPWFEVG